MALAATTIMVTAGSASANDTPGINWDHTFSGRGATVYVEEHGDIIELCDSVANGHSAWIDVNGQYIMRVSGGKGSCVSHQASDGAAYNLPEGEYIALYWDGEGRSSTNFGSGFQNDH
jgi:hypothetical protein